MEEVIYTWNPARKVVINPDMKMSQFDLIAVPVSNKTNVERKSIKIVTQENIDWVVSVSPSKRRPIFYSFGEFSFPETYGFVCDWGIRALYYAGCALMGQVLSI